MTAPKRKNDAPLTRIERGRLRQLADMLERFASLPSDDPPPRVRVELVLGVDLHTEFIRVLRIAGAPTAADVRGIAERIGHDLMQWEGLPPSKAARDTLTALHECGLPEYPGARFPPPTATAVRDLAGRLSRRSRRRK
jgi:hypothetical protein